MENPTNVSYFDKLPDEIKINVLRYITTADLINFCDTFEPYEYLSHDKDIAWHLNFHKLYELKAVKIVSYISKCPRCEVITSLNVNSVYWIPLREFHKCLQKLPALQSLYAVDTKLGLTNQDCKLYHHMPKINTLAVTIEGKELSSESCSIFPDIKRLYLHIMYPHGEMFFILGMLLQKLQHLEDIWIVDRSPVTIRDTFYTLRYLPKSVKKCTLLLSNINFEPTVVVGNLEYFKKVYEFKKRRVELSFERPEKEVANIYSKEYSEGHAVWNCLLNELRCDKPFCKKDAYLLSHGKYNLHTIKFEELNFCHADAVCCAHLRNSVNKILFSENAKRLKKLCINFCTCNEDSNVENSDAEYLFKKPRIFKSKNAANAECNFSYENLFEQCRYLEELELMGCDTVKNSLTTVRGLQHLKFLKRLSLVNTPLTMNGDFLTEVCKSCEFLKHMNVKPVSFNASVNNSICAALPWATNLQDFRLDHMHIPLDRLFDALNSIQNSKLRRVYLKCKIVEKFSVAPFERFLSANPQLVALLLVLEELPQSSLVQVRKTLHKFKTGMEKIFLVSKNDLIFNSKLPMPDIHRVEMVQCETNVCVLDIFNGFLD